MLNPRGLRNHYRYDQDHRSGRMAWLYEFVKLKTREMETEERKATKIAEVLQIRRLCSPSKETNRMKSDCEMNLSLCRIDIVQK